MKKTDVDEIMDGSVSKDKFYNCFYKGEYIKWITNILSRYESIDDVFFVKNSGGLLSSCDYNMICYLEYFLLEINRFMVKSNKPINNIGRYYFKYNDQIYVIGRDDECNYLSIFNGKEEDITYIDYEDIEKMYISTMECNFSLLKDRVLDAIENTDLEYIRYTLSCIDKPTIVSGVGGSNVVSEFTSKVISSKNKIITINSELRDLFYLNNDLFKNLIVCSYGAKNNGVKKALKSNLNKYLLSGVNIKDNDITNLTYKTKIPCEVSFISLAATLIPVSIMLNYYTDGNCSHLFDFINETKTGVGFSNIIEIFSGYDTKTTSSYLESTLAESGIAIPIVHDKYSYCHGRSTLCYNNEATAIYLNRNTELDKLLLDQIRGYYKNVIVIESKYNDQILDDYYMLVKAMYLTKEMASYNNKDLSCINYSPIVRKIYRYNGKM